MATALQDKNGTYTQTKHVINFAEFLILLTAEQLCCPTVLAFFVLQGASTMCSCVSDTLCPVKMHKQSYRTKFLSS